MEFKSFFAILRVGLAFLLTYEIHEVLLLAPLCVVENKVGFERCLVGIIGCEVGLRLGDVEHEVLSATHAYHHVLSQLLEDLIASFHTISDPLLLQIEVIDLSAGELGQLGADAVFGPYK